MSGSGGIGDKGLPAQSAPSLRTHLLQFGKGYRALIRYTRSQQRQHNEDLHYADVRNISKAAAASRSFTLLAAK